MNFLPLRIIILVRHIILVVPLKACWPLAVGVVVAEVVR